MASKNGIQEAVQHSWNIGDIIMMSNPFAYVLMNQKRGTYCENCFKSTNELLRCSACALSKYCDVSCQKKSWKFHRHECKGFRRIAPHIPKDSCLLFFRILLQLKCGNGVQCSEQAFGTDRRFSDLISHVDEVKRDASRCEEYVQLYSALKAFVGDDFELPESSVLLEIFGKMTVNTFSICDPEMQPIGAGIYLGASILNHSCKPNAVVVFSGTRLQVRCTEPILDNEEVFISYLDQLDTTADRRRQLETCYYFTCHCTQCSDYIADAEMQSYSCPTRNCSSPILQQIDGELSQCPECGYSEFDEDYLSARQSAAANCLEALEQAKRLKNDGKATELLQLCESHLTGDCSVLHSFNILNIKLLDRAFDACIDTNDCQKAVNYGLKLVKLYKRYLSTYHPNVGVHLMKLGKIQLYLEQCSDAQISLQQAETILAVTHGTASHIYSDLQQLLQQCAFEELSHRHLQVQEIE